MHARGGGSLGAREKAEADEQRVVEGERVRAVDPYAKKSQNVQAATAEDESRVGFGREIAHDGAGPEIDVDDGAESGQGCPPRRDCVAVTAPHAYDKLEFIKLSSARGGVVRKVMNLVLDDEDVLELMRILLDDDEPAAVAWLRAHLEAKARDRLEEQSRPNAMAPRGAAHERGMDADRDL